MSDCWESQNNQDSGREGRGMNCIAWSDTRVVEN